MDRKESIKTMLLGTLSFPFLKRDAPLDMNEKAGQITLTEPMRSRWYEWPDMNWVGPDFWGNRLQDWRISDGKVECMYSGGNRNLQSLTHQLDKRTQDFTTSVQAEVLNKTGSGNDYVGFRLGAKAKDAPCPVTFTDYRRAAVYGEGLDAGITADGRLFIGDKKSPHPIKLGSAIRLEVKGMATARLYTLELSAIDDSDGGKLGSLTAKDINPDDLTGNVGLVAHFASEDDEAETPSVRFSDWMLSGGKVIYHAGQVYGPILFAQYTMNRKIVKLTAQLTPIEANADQKISMQVREDGQWKTLQETTVHPLARTAQFRFEDWPYAGDMPYRLRLELPLKERAEEFFYEGTIAADPGTAGQLKAALFSCNQDHGFPDTEVVHNVAKHRPHMALFLGDQFYEGFGGFGVDQSHDLEMTTLDYLHKWYMFGWSYREIFRHIPSVFIPDDHDVFHGNVWGQGGKAANTDKGFGSPAQDTGGYKMLAEWVKMVERTQTSHLPDPYDPTPVKQGIGVYYTDWIYGGISFAILEDRKFKSAPANVLPKEADVNNGFIRNPDFDLNEYYDIEANLLGERQHKFLEEWVSDWSEGAQMKVVLSQSPLSGPHTLPKGEASDTIVPRRPIPERGEYPEGDYPALDMDTNGWPAKERDKALRIIRKASALHIAGDQHLASMIRYGVDNFEDAGYVYTLPALNNTWPRRWWPAVDKDHRPLPGRPKYTGHFRDAFDNRMTVVSVANPVKTNRQPSIIYDRATGYGIVNFDKNNRSTRIECWPRYVDPMTNPEGQYEGWPFFIEQKDNDGRQPVGYLPEFNTNEFKDPVFQVFHQQSGQLEYALRIKGRTFRPHVYEEGLYKVRIGDPDRNQWLEYDNLTMDQENSLISCKFT
ncbi:MAG: alkaline phosphatase D family protein [Balneolales bacterium]